MPAAASCARAATVWLHGAHAAQCLAPCPQHSPDPRQLVQPGRRDGAQLCHQLQRHQLPRPAPPAGAVARVTPPNAGGCCGTCCGQLRRRQGAAAPVTRTGAALRRGHGREVASGHGSAGAAPAITSVTILLSWPWARCGRQAHLACTGGGTPKTCACTAAHSNRIGSCADSCIGGDAAGIRLAGHHCPCLNHPGQRCGPSPWTAAVGRRRGPPPWAAAVDRRRGPPAPHTACPHRAGHPPWALRARHVRARSPVGARSLAASTSHMYTQARKRPGQRALRLGARASRTPKPSATCTDHARVHA